MINFILKNFYYKTSSALMTEAQFDALAKSVKIAYLAVISSTFILGLLSAKIIPDQINPLSLWFTFLSVNFVALSVNYFANFSFALPIFKKILQIYQQKYPNGPQISNALIQNAFRFKLIKPALLILMHSAWLSYFLAATLSMTVFFIFTEAHFKLESTLLNFDEISYLFSYLFTILNSLPQLLGFPAINAQMITETLQASSQSNASNFVQITHKMWALWLLGQLIVWGLLLRFALLMTEYYKLQHRLKCISAISSVHIQEIDANYLSNNGYQRGAKVQKGEGAWGIFFETDMFMLPSPNFKPFHVDDKYSRHQLLDQLKIKPAAKLLIIIDASQTPDRGSVRYLLQILDLSVDNAIYLHSLHPDDAQRRHLWQTELLPLLTSTENLIKEHSMLINWLNT